MASVPLSCPPFTSTALGPSASSAAPALPSRLRWSPRGRSSRRAASARFGVDEVGERHKSARTASTASGSEQQIAAGCDHDRIDDEWVKLVTAVRPSATAITVARSLSMPVLIAPIVESPSHGIDLRRDEPPARRCMPRDAAGALRRQRRHDAGAVDAEHREGLEVGLDAGAARGVRSGDGQRDGPRLAASSSVGRGPLAAGACAGASRSSRSSGVTICSMLAHTPGTCRASTAEPVDGAGEEQHARQHQQQAPISSPSCRDGGGSAS